MTIVADSDAVATGRFNLVGRMQALSHCPLLFFNRTLMSSVESLNLLAAADVSECALEFTTLSECALEFTTLSECALEFTTLSECACA